MNFGFVASLIVIITAVLSVFIEIPIVSKLRLLVRGRRLHHACGNGVRRLRYPNRPKPNIAKGGAAAVAARPLLVMK